MLTSECSCNELKLSYPIPWAHSCKWLKWLFEFVLLNINTREQHANWNSINAFIRDLGRARFKNLHILPSAQIFLPAFLHCFRIYSPSFMFLSIMKPRRFCSLLSHIWLYPIFANISLHAYTQIKVKDICYYAVSYNYFQAIELLALNDVLIFEWVTIIKCSIISIITDICHLVI